MKRDSPPPRRLPNRSRRKMDNYSPGVIVKWTTTPRLCYTDQLRTRKSADVPPVRGSGRVVEQTWLSGDTICHARSCHLMGGLPLLRAPITLFNAKLSALLGIQWCASTAHLHFREAVKSFCNSCLLFCTVWLQSSTQYFVQTVCNFVCIILPRSSQVRPGILGQPTILLSIFRCVVSSFSK